MRGSSACAASTGPASRPCSTCWPAPSGPTRAMSGSLARTPPGGPRCAGRGPGWRGPGRRSASRTAGPPSTTWPPPACATPASGCSARCGGPRRRPRRERAWAALERLGIGHLGGQLVDGLTLEDQRLTELARAIVSEPTVLLADEPASGLSAAQRTVLADALTAVSADRAVVVVEHDLDMLTVDQRARVGDGRGAACLLGRRRVLPRLAGVRGPARHRAGLSRRLTAPINSHGSNAPGSFVAMKTTRCKCLLNN